MWLFKLQVTTFFFFFVEFLLINILTTLLFHTNLHYLFPCHSILCMVWRKDLVGWGTFQMFHLPFWKYPHILQE